MTPLRVVGVVLAGLGVVMAAFPDWFGALTGGSIPAADAFEAVERRIRGGMLLGLGLLLVAHTELRPWSSTIAASAFYIVFGALLARVFGIMVDGSDSRQWMWVAGESLVIGLAAAWLWRAGSAG